MLHTILIILALVSLGLATANVPSQPRLNWLPLGLFFFVLSTLVFN